MRRRADALLLTPATLNVNVRSAIPMLCYFVHCASYCAWIDHFHFPLKAYFDSALSFPGRPAEQPLVKFERACFFSGHTSRLHERSDESASENLNHGDIVWPKLIEKTVRGTLISRTSTARECAPFEIIKPFAMIHAHLV